MLGPGKHDLYKQGKLTLADLVGVKEDARWGKSRYQRSIGDALAAAEKRIIAQAPGTHANLYEAAFWAGHHYPHITWDFTGAHIDTINPTLKQFHTLAQEWPQVSKRLTYVGTHQSAKTPYPDGWKDGGIAHADAGYGTFIGLNPAYYGNPPRILASVQTYARSGWFPKGCDTVESLVTHEFGHLVDSLFQSQRMTAFREIVKTDGFGFVAETFQLWAKSNKARKSLSGYAVNDPKQIDVEGWAEGFRAIYHTPKKDWPVFVRRQAALLAIMNPRNWRTQYQWLNHLSGDAKTQAVEEMARVRKRLGMK